MGSPDLKTGWEQELERAPSIPEAARLLFGMFGEVSFYNSFPESSQELLREEKLSSSFHGNPHFEVYEGMSDFYWFPYKSGPRRSRTDRYTPESPLIDPGDIQRVGEIITATFLHHNLRVRGKPGDDIVFVGESGGGAYGFKKDQRKGEGNPFWKLDSWKSVRELLLITPGKQQDGVILEFWEKDDRDNYYELQAGLACKGISMLELFERLGS